MIKHMEELEVLLMNKHPALLFLSEARVTEDIQDCEISFRGYITLRCNADTRHTGGVIIIIKNNIEFQVISNLAYNKNFWLLSISITKGFQQGLYTVIYHSPSSSDAEFILNFENWCEDSVQEYSKYVIVGDFNIDVSKDSFYAKKLIGTIQNLGMKQMVRDYTRVTESSSTLIDLVITNIVNLKVEVLDTPKITDHSIIELTMRKNCISHDNNTIRLKNFANYNQSNLLNRLSYYKWNTTDINVNITAAEMVQALQNSLNDLSTYKTIKLRVKNPWFNAELRDLQKDRDRLYKIAKLSSAENDWRNYKNTRNYYCNLIKLRKNSYYEAKIQENHGDSKNMWKLIKGIIKHDTKDTIKKVIFEDVESTDADEISQKFNEYFVNSITAINMAIPYSSFKEVPVPESDNIFKFKEVTLMDLKKTIAKIKRKGSTDGISIHVINDALPVIGNTFVQLINESMRNGIFPESWKKAKIVPIQKIPLTKKCEEFRPINMLPVYEQILEVIVKDQLQEFLESNNTLSYNQSGFRNKHSCETALNLVLANWKSELDLNKSVVGVFLDYKRAFETIDRNRLLMKLEKYGIRGVEKKWFESYLTSRSQTTVFGGGESTEILNNLGVPQGSVLGPILFVLYINDLVLNVKYCSLNLFADDTLVSVSDDNVINAVNKMNMDLDVIAKWLQLNKLKLNIPKTKFIVISNKNQENKTVKIKIEDLQLEQVSQIKYLGVIIDNKLSFRNNVDFIIKKVAKKISFLGRISSKLSTQARILVYKSIIAPHFDYCASILFLCHDGDLQRLQKQQNRAMRIILQCSKFTSISFMLDALQWLSIKQRIYFNTLVLIYKAINKLLPEYMSHKLMLNAEVHNYKTRKCLDLRLPKLSKSCTQNCLYYKGIKIYNTLPAEAKMATNLYRFKRCLSNHVKQNF